MSEGGPGVIDWERRSASEPHPGVLARRFDTEHATVVRYELAPGSSYPLHSHPEEQLVHVLSGGVSFSVADADLSLAAGDLLHIPGGVPHGSYNPGPEKAVFLNIVLPRRPS